MINKKYLPSKNFLAALFVAAILILITIALNYAKPKTPDYANSVADASTTAPWVNNIDSDNDGLPDWQEVLYATDSHNPDSDRDGTTDGDEIKAQRDPLKANTAKNGINDKIAANIIAQDKNISAAMSPDLSATEKMAHNLMSGIFASQPVSGQMDQYTMNALVQQSLADIPQKQFAGTTTVSDLNLIPVSSNVQTLKKDLVAFGNKYMLLTGAFEKIMGQDLAIVQDSLSNQTVLDAKKMTLIVSIYQYIKAALISLPLPAVSDSAGAIYDMQIINNIQKLIQIDSDIINSSSKSDTASVYADLGIYHDTLDNLTEALDAMDAMLGIKR